MSSLYTMALIASFAGGVPRLISGQGLAAASDFVSSTPAVLTGPNDIFYDRLSLDRDQEVAWELHQVLHEDKRLLDADQDKLHHTHDQAKWADLEQRVTVLRGCVAAEEQLAREDKHDIRVDRRDLREDAHG